MSLHSHTGKSHDNVMDYTLDKDSDSDTYSVSHSVSLSPSHNHEVTRSQNKCVQDPTQVKRGRKNSCKKRE